MKTFINTGERAASRRQPLLIDFQNNIVEMYLAREGMESGVEKGRGRRFIRWTFDKRLEKNHTLSIMENFRRNINSDFYIKYNYAYVIVDNGTGLKMVYSKQQRSSPRIDPFVTRKAG